MGPCAILQREQGNFESVAIQPGDGSPALRVAGLPGAGHAGAAGLIDAHPGYHLGPEYPDQGVEIFRELSLILISIMYS